MMLMEGVTVWYVLVHMTKLFVRIYATRYICAIGLFSRSVCNMRACLFK